METKKKMSEMGRERMKMKRGRKRKRKRKKKRKTPFWPRCLWSFVVVVCLLHAGADLSPPLSGCLRQPCMLCCVVLSSEFPLRVRGMDSLV